jgi:hypothetical protein
MKHVNDSCQCTGKLCTNCHALLCIGEFTKDKRLKSGLRSRCRTCAGKANKQWRQENKEYDTARHRAWNRAHAEHNREVRREYRKRNAARINAYNRQRYSDHIELFKARQRQYRERGLHLRRIRRQKPEIKEKERSSWKHYYTKNNYRLNQQAILWRKHHPRQWAAIQAARRTRQTLTGGSYTHIEWIDLCAKYDLRCLCCGRQEPDIKLTADHIIPVSMGGSSYIDNIQPLCKSCNSSKGTKIIDFRN